MRVCVLVSPPTFLRFRGFLRVKKKSPWKIKTLQLSYLPPMSFTQIARDQSQFQAHIVKGII